MLGWLAGRYLTKETRRLLAIVREMPSTARRQVMAHVADKMGLADNAGAGGAAEFYLAMKCIAEEAQRERQSAVSYGARTFSDPRWCAPALVEQWAIAWLGMKQGRMSRARFEKIDAVLWEAINEALAPAEIIKAGHQSAPKIFLSYRREDSAGDARAIFGSLTQYFGADNIFFDVNSIAAGERFEVELRHALSESAAFLPIIGPSWLRVMYERLRDNEPDYVRLEVETALQLQLPIIPVVLSREGKVPPVPRPQELPVPIGDLFAHQVHAVSHENFERDVMELVWAIRDQVTERLSRQWMMTPQRQGLTNLPAPPSAPEGESKIRAIEFVMRLDEAFKRFFEIDEVMFKMSVRPIHFDAHRLRLVEIENELAQLQTSAERRGEQPFVIAALYTERLRTAVQLLLEICAGLELKAQGNKGPSWAEYNALVDAYGEAKNSYSALGSDMNKFRRDARLIDERARC